MKCQKIPIIYDYLKWTAKTYKEAKVLFDKIGIKNWNLTAGGGFVFTDSKSIRRAVRKGDYLLMDSEGRCKTVSGLVFERKYEDVGGS